MSKHHSPAFSADEVVEVEVKVRCDVDDSLHDVHWTATLIARDINGLEKGPEDVILDALVGSDLNAAVPFAVERFVPCSLDTEVNWDEYDIEGATYRVSPV